jgi:hypothetical protein
MADNPPPSSADVTESGNLNLPEPSGPHRPVKGMLFLYIPVYFVAEFSSCVATFPSLNIGHIFL